MQRIVPNRPTVPALVLAAAALVFGFPGGQSAVVAQTTMTAKLTAIRCGTLIDGKSDAAVAGAVILIEDGRILEVGRNIAIPAGAEVVDLSGSTVLPGLIDCHTHLLLHGGSYEDQLLRESVPMRAILGTVAAKKTLEAGFTTVRDVETEGAMYADVDLREAVAAGHIPGPRIFAATRALVPTGTYAPYGFSWELDVPTGAQFADGPDGVRKAVREQISHGADWIKIYADSRYRHRNADSLVGTPTFTDAELEAIVDAAENVGIHVCAHAYTSDAAKRALRAGVRSIEHGLYLDESAFTLMKDKGAYWVPTLAAYVSTANDTSVPAANRKAWIAAAARHRESFQRGLRSGVKIAFGTDVYSPHGAGVMEFGLMADYGMAPMKIIKSATSVAAELLGISKSTGTIEPGKAADIVAVKGDVLKDIRLLERVGFVMKGGRVYRQE